MKNISMLLTNTKPTEVYSITEIIIADFESAGLVSDKYLLKIIDLLKMESEKLTKAVVPVKTKSLLKQKDKTRVNIFRSLNNLLKGYINHPEEEINAPAKKVYKIFKRYGTDVLRLGYASKGAMISSMLTDLSIDSLKKEIDSLSGIRKLIDNLTTAENDFSQTWVEYDSHKAAEAESDSATKIAKRIISIINKQLVIYIRAMKTTDQLRYGDFAAIISNIINENNVLVKKRAKKHKQN